MRNGAPASVISSPFKARKPQPGLTASATLLSVPEETLKMPLVELFVALNYRNIESSVLCTWSPERVRRTRLMARAGAGLVHERTRNRPRLLVVDDDAGIRTSLRVSLELEGYEVDDHANGSELEGVVERFRPDLAILDVRLPSGPDGLGIARSLRGKGDLPILFLTAADSVDERLAGFAAGGDDYLIKPFSMAELLARTAALLRRSGRLVSAVWQVGDLVVDDASRTVVRDSTTLDVTRTEYELLATLLRHSGQVLSKVQLLTQVWGFEVFDVNLVEVHVSALRRKLESHGPRLVHTVRGVGYVLRA
jgi:two-component system OmpR family response regulator